MCVLGGKSESQRQQLPAEGGLLQARAEGLARLQRRGEAADQQAAGQVGLRHRVWMTSPQSLLSLHSLGLWVVPCSGMCSGCQ